MTTAKYLLLVKYRHGCIYIAATFSITSFHYGIYSGLTLLHQIIIKYKGFALKQSLAIEFQWHVGNSVLFSFSEKRTCLYTISFYYLVPILVCDQKPEETQIS